MQSDPLSLDPVPTKHLWTGQAAHLLLLALLVSGAVYLAQPVLGDGSWLGISDSTWFAWLLGATIIHQLVGWFVFRTQLVFRLFTRLFGARDLLVWGWIFFPLFVLRPVLTIGLALADAGSLGGWRPLQIGLGLLLLLPALYTLWSVEKYFGFERALGGDHFREKYRQMPLVREGAFRFSGNAMYSFAFLLFWGIGLLSGSWAALVGALFQHAYIWVHMYCTEEPDMRYLHGSSSEAKRS